MKVDGWATAADGAVVSTSAGRLRLQQLSPHVLRVVFTDRPDFSDRPSVAVLPQDPVAPTVEEDADRLTVSTGPLRLDIDRSSGAFTWTAGGALLFREPHDGRDTKLLEPVDVVLTDFSGASRAAVSGTDGMKVATEGGRRHVDRSAYATTLRLELSGGEAVYGLGQHEDGILNYRGRSQDLYQENMKVAIPVLVSTRGYAIVWDSGSAARFSDGPDGTTFCTDVDDEMDFYVVHGPELEQIVGHIRALTGQVPMLPKWALGYLQSKERYTDAQELLDVVAEHRRRHIPIDAVVQDWKTWPGELWGQKSFDPERYPDPGALCTALHAANAHLIVSIWPNLHNDGPDQLEMREWGFLLGDDSTYDARIPAARELYWQQTRAGYFDHGVDGWWADCTEPFEADWKGAVKPDREERKRINVEEAEKYLDPEEINSYSLVHTSGLYEGQRSTDPGKRVVVLTRSASLGQQRYGAVTWSGDISATWSTLRRQIADGLSFCLTGNPRWSTDIGAFFVGHREDLWFWAGDFPDGVADPGYRELYVRWLQLGTFLPMMRSHGTETPREPWRFGAPGDAAYDTIVAFIRLRYRLLPYLYSLHAQETRAAYTTMRALAFDFRADPVTHNIDDQFMVGPALLVCPVTEPLYWGPESTRLAEQPRTRSVYLPAGADWYDFWTGERHRGGQTLTADARLGVLPLFVRAGSILPLGAEVEHSGASGAGPMEIRVYPGADGTFELYDDAGDGYGYEAGEYTLTALHWDDATDTLRLDASAGAYPGQPEVIDATVVRVGPGRGVGGGVSPGRPDVALGRSPTEVRLRPSR